MQLKKKKKKKEKEMQDNPNSIFDYIKIIFY